MDDGHITTQELIAQLEAKDRHFRAASVLFGVLLIAAVVTLLFIGLNTLQGVRSQLSEQRKLLDSQQQILAKIQDSSKQRTAQINDLQNHIDCIVELFRQPNHTNLTITDVQSCQLTAASSGGASGSTKSGLNATPQHNAGSTPKATPKAQPANKSPQVAPPSDLDKLPVIGGVFKALGV